MQWVALKPVALLLLQKAMRWGVSGKRRHFLPDIFCTVWIFTICTYTSFENNVKSSSNQSEKSIWVRPKKKTAWRFVWLLQTVKVGPNVEEAFFCAGVGELLSRGLTWQSNVLQKSSLGWIGVSRLGLSQLLWTARRARMRTRVVLMQERAEGKRGEWERLERWTH